MVASQQFPGGGNETDNDLQVSFDTPDSGNGLVVRDPIERRQLSFETPGAVRPTPADPAEFWFPADSAVRLETSAIRLPKVWAIFIRTDDGELLAKVEHFADESFPEGTYSLEISGPVKTYLRVDGEVRVSSDAVQTTVEFGDSRPVLVGARSHHKHPAATITTTDDPRDLMAAVSAFGSALKTTSVERSYPSLRGHPPLLELGDDLDIPEGLDPPDTGVRIELPPEYRYVYVATPLAYYLGAKLVPGGVPRIVTDRGFEYRLDTIAGFEREVERVLKQVFFFDCLVRTEGIYKIDLHERQVLESVLDPDFAELYEWPLARQLEAYLDVPFTAVEAHLPEWKLTTHIAPSADNLEMLPFVTNDLAVVRTPESRQVSSSEVQTSAAGEFFRSESFTRSASSSAPSRTYVQPERDGSLEQAWVGDGTPVGASKSSTQAYRNRLDRSPANGDITISVICNDAKMADERDVVESVYGSRVEVPFEVDRHYDLSVEELRDVLQRPTEFFHYIGHIDEDGFECRDGKLDVSEVDSVGMDSFLLNACQSYEQGEHLVDAGAIGGIVTLADVVNSGAVEMGGALARLLNRGFSLRSALDLARDESVIGNQYIVVGDGGLSVTQAGGFMPNVCEIRKVSDEYELEYLTYPNTEHGMGTLIAPAIEGNEQYYLSSGTIDTFSISRVGLSQFLSMEDTPVILAGELHWSNSLTVDDIDAYFEQ